MTRLDYELFLRTKLPVPFKDEEGNEIVNLKDLDRLVQKELSLYDSELEERIYFEFKEDERKDIIISFWYKGVQLDSSYNSFIYNDSIHDKYQWIEDAILFFVKSGGIDNCLRIQEEQAIQEQKEIQETKQAISRSNGWSIK